MSRRTDDRSSVRMDSEDAFDDTLAGTEATLRRAAAEVGCETLPRDVVGEWLSRLGSGDSSV